jgi:serine/threonine-protein kinase HipA
MSIGSHYRWWDISSRDWHRLAAELALESERVAVIVRHRAQLIADEAQGCARDARDGGLDHPIFDRLIDSIAVAAQRCLRVMDTATPASSRP